MKKLITLLLALCFVAMMVASCDMLPPELAEQLGGIVGEVPGTGDDIDDTTDKTPHEHSYTSRVKEPTCILRGYTEHVCECGASYQDDYVDAKGHSYTSETVEPTCTTDGYTIFRCDCGNSYNSNTTLALGHAFELVSGVAPTSIDEGYTKYACHCGTEKKDNFVAPKETSVGLVFELSEDESYYIVTDIGSCKDKRLIIQRTYRGLPVAAIGQNAFHTYSPFTEVVIPDSVRVIGNNAFAESNLTSVVIPEGVVTIEECAFMGCHDLVSVTIPKTVVEIGDRAFAGWTTSLIYIDVDAENTAYKSVDGNLYTKDGKTLVRYAAGKSANSFTVNEGVEVLGYGAFESSRALTEVVLPQSLTKIGEAAFENCNFISEMFIPKNVSVIGSYVFWGANLTAITVDKDNECYKSVDGNLYTKDGKTLLNYAAGKEDIYFKVPDGVEVIGKSAFYCAYSLVGISLPDGLTKIEAGAFSCCFALKQIVIPDTVKEIGAAAFSSCSELKSIVLPVSVKVVGQDAFSNCDQFENVYYFGTNKNWNVLVIDTNNEALTSAERYYYSESSPTDNGNYWHYNEYGEITVW